MMMMLFLLLLLKPGVHIDYEFCSNKVYLPMN